MIGQLVRGSGWRQAGLPFDDTALATIGTPTLLVYGTDDEVGDAVMWRRFVAAMPHAELEILEGAGHMPWFDRPHDVAARIGRFLAAEA